MLKYSSVIWDWVCPCASCKFPGKEKHVVLLGRKLTKTPPIRWKSDLESLQSLPLKETCTSLCTFRWWIFQKFCNTDPHAGWPPLVCSFFHRSQCCFTQKEVKLYEVPMVEKWVDFLLTLKKKKHGLGLGGEIFSLCVFKSCPCVLTKVVGLKKAAHFTKILLATNDVFKVGM